MSSSTRSSSSNNNNNSNTTSTKFQYVLIPANEELPIRLFEDVKSGGLVNDILIQNAKEYFFELTGAKGRSAHLRAAIKSKDDRIALAKQIREELMKEHEDAATNNNNGTTNIPAGTADGSIADRVSKMDDETVVNIMLQSQGVPNCDVTALTIPTNDNGYMAVSMYTAQHGRHVGLPMNKRATEISIACHGGSGSTATSVLFDATSGGVSKSNNNNNNSNSNLTIYGDVFIGRAHDNEIADIWERVDFTIEDADVTKATWFPNKIKKSTKPTTNTNTPDMNELQRMLQQQGGTTTDISQFGDISSFLQEQAKENEEKGLSFEEEVASIRSKLGRNGSSAVYEKEYDCYWTQTNEEIELKFIHIPINIKAKQCNVEFHTNTLSVNIIGHKEYIKKGTTLFDRIDLDETTYTLQTVVDATADGGSDTEQQQYRELCITLGKKEKKKVWQRVFQS